MLQGSPEGSREDTVVVWPGGPVMVSGRGSTSLKMEGLLEGCGF